MATRKEQKLLDELKHRGYSVLNIYYTSNFGWSGGWGCDIEIYDEDDNEFYDEFVELGITYERAMANIEADTTKPPLSSLTIVHFNIKL